MGVVCVIVVFFVAGVLLMNCKTRKEVKTTIMYGYPRYRKTWLTIYHYRESDKWVFEWDDLFDEGRPKSWGDISEFLMYKGKNVHDDEYKKALELLKSDGLY